MAVESLKVLRRRIRSVNNIRQITRAMEMVAAAKLRRTQGALAAGRPYATKLRELLAHLAEGSELGSHPLFVPREGNRKILVLYTADRGLCGSYNSNAIKRAEEVLRAEPDAQWQLVTIGRRGHDYFQRRRWPILDSVRTLGGQADGAEAQRVARLLVGRYLAGEIDGVWLLYQAFVSSVLSRPTLVRYLSLTPEALGLDEKGGRNATARHDGPRVDYLLEPSAGAVFDALLPRFLASRIYITMAEAAASEHSARMVAMNNATMNCDEMSDSLTLRMNNARQASITKELLEIVGGANAIQG
jgi:F-type H+-transporting ATPase subunit gamma